MSMENTLIAALVALLPSCATLVGQDDIVPITSEPPGIHFTTSEGMEGTTPTMYNITERSSDLVVTFDNPGYEVQVIERPTRLSGWVLGNVIFGGFIGLGIDLIAEQGFTHGDEPIHAIMVPTPSPYPVPGLVFGDGVVHQDLAHGPEDK